MGEEPYELKNSRTVLEQIFDLSREFFSHVNMKEIVLKTTNFPAESLEVKQGPSYSIYSREGSAGLQSAQRNSEGQKKFNSNFRIHRAKIIPSYDLKKRFMFIKLRRKKSLSLVSRLNNIKSNKRHHCLPLNKQNQIINKTLFFEESQTGYLYVRGPGVVRANDLKLPSNIQCVDPDQYIATLSEDGVLIMKFSIIQGCGDSVMLPLSKTTTREGGNGVTRDERKTTNLQKQVRHYSTMKKRVQSPFLSLNPPLGSNEDFFIPAKGEDRPFMSIQRGFNLNFLNKYKKKPTNKSLDFLRELLEKRSINSSFSNKKFDLKNSLPLLLDTSFMPVIKVNYTIEKIKTASLSRDPSWVVSPYDSQAEEVGPKINIDNTATHGMLTGTGKTPPKFPSLRDEKQADALPAPLTLGEDMRPLATPQVRRNNGAFLFRQKEQPPKGMERTRPQRLKTSMFALPKVGNVTTKTSINLVTSQQKTSNKYILKRMLPETGSFKERKHLSLLQKEKDIYKNEFVYAIVLEVWTNGSITPRTALSQACQYLMDLFVNIKNTKNLSAFIQDTKG